jgi:hypothetical protein
VILYTEQQFRDITQAPAWSDGQFDGKIRISTKGVARSFEDLDRIVRGNVVWYRHCRRKGESLLYWAGGPWGRWKELQPRDRRELITLIALVVGLFVGWALTEQRADIRRAQARRLDEVLGQGEGHSAKVASDTENYLS